MIFHNEIKKCIQIQGYYCGYKAYFWLFYIEYCVMYLNLGLHFIFLTYYII